MSSYQALARLSEPLRAAIEAKGFTELTTVQQAVLAPSIQDRDLRVTSQTGSGKTVAIGLSLRGLVEQAAATRRDAGEDAVPTAIVIAPTRELARQSRTELGWLYAKLGVGVAAVTGGAGYRDELRALARGPAVVVGTPGRLLDHLKRGALSTDGLRAVVLDEADHMLDLGFREDLEAILAFLPADRRTHLVSATFPRAVEALASAVQRDPVSVQGTRLGVANADIEHVLHLVHASDRLGATVNLLLAEPNARTLVFARTRAGVAELAAELTRVGFPVCALSGELDQQARNRALAQFREGSARVLVATDVAARGIDVADVARVVQVDPPTDADVYTHRAGRTGRAGSRGTSSVLVTPGARARVERMLRSARVRARFEPLPDPAALRKAADARLLGELTLEPRETAAHEREPGDPAPAEPPPRMLALADQLLAVPDPRPALARLLARAHGSIEPWEVRSPQPPARRPGPGQRAPRNPRGKRPAHDRPGQRRAPGGPQPGFATFHVSWGLRDGAEPPRVLAMVCRRGGIAGRKVGAIRIEERFCLVDIAVDAASGFARRACRPDPRDPRIVIRPDRKRPGPRRPPRPDASGPR